jgi:hypothetical protein
MVSSGVMIEIKNIITRSYILDYMEVNLRGDLLVAMDASCS